MLRTAGLHLPVRKARPRASTPRSPHTPAGYYKGHLVPPLAGLPPASHRELQDTRAQRSPDTELVNSKSAAHAPRKTKTSPLRTRRPAVWVLVARVVFWNGVWLECPETAV